jgi:replicative DNA helicase
MEAVNASAIYAERAVIGGMLMDGEAAEAAVSQLTEDDFADETYREIFRGAAALASQGKPVDTVTILPLIRTELKQCAVRAAQETPSVSGYQHYIDIVKEESLRRRLLDAVMKAQADLVEGAAVETVAAELTEATTIAEKPAKTLKTAWEAMGRTITALERIREEGKPTGITTGFGDVDRKIGTFERKGYYVLGARSGMGKTALLLCMVRAAAKSGKRALVFSLEMPAEGPGGLSTRLLSQETQISHDTIRFARYRDSDLRLMQQQAGEPYMQDIVIDDRADITVLQMRSVIRQVKPDIVYIDYLGLIKGRAAEKRYIEVDNISHDLKKTAKLYDIPVVALVQLNRETENKKNGRKDGRPTLADIRESDAIVHDADAVMLLYRPSKYDSHADKDKAELIVGKNRQGQAGIIPLSWTGETMTFTGLFFDGTHAPPSPPKLKAGYDDVEEL